jgi:hypothetical protein
MNAGVLLFVISDVKNYLVAKNLLSTDGAFGALTVGQDIEIATVVKNSIESHGTDLPDEIDKVLAILPLVLQLVGIK